MKQLKRIVAFALGFIMLFSCIVPVSAAGTATLSVGIAEGSAGSKVTVPITIEQNSGFVSLSLSVTYDMSALTLVSVHDTCLIDGGYHSPYYDSPYRLSWENDIRTSNYSVTGVIAELEFLIAEDAPDKEYSITVTMNTHGALDKDGNEVSFTLKNGKIAVSEPEHQCSFGVWKEYNSRKHVRICDECGEREYENHSWDDGKILEEPSCDVEGEILYTCEDCGCEKYDWIDPEPHDYGDWVKLDDAQHMRVCTSCDQSFSEPHSWDLSGGKYVCTVCGAIQSEHVHSFGWIITYSPTCLLDGYTVYKCEACSETKKDDVVPALGHNYVNGVCSRCDSPETSLPSQNVCDAAIESVRDLYFDSGDAVIQIEIKNLGMLSIVPCRYEVYKGAPDGELVSQKTIQGLEPGETVSHSFKANNDPNQTEIYYIILRCSDGIFYDQNPANNYAAIVTKTINESCFHNFTHWEAISGERHTGFCDACGKTVTHDHFFVSDVDGCVLCGAPRPTAHEHHFVEYFTFRPTCTQQGYTEYRCEECFEVKKDSFVPALGHDYVNGECDRCGDVEPKPAMSAKLSVSTHEAMAGETVQVTVDLADNPGLTSLVFKVNFDQTLLTLTNVTYNTAMGGQTVPPKNLSSPVILYWVDGLSDYKGNGLFATLTFTVSENAKEGDSTDITVSYLPDDVFNVREENVGLNVSAGKITVINYVPGDINGDGVLNNKDVTRLMQYYAGWDVTVNTPALDVNNDGACNNKDVTRLMQFQAGWDVEIH